MRKVCKTVFCVVVILLLGIFSQQGAKAGETNEGRYSRTYSVLSANVGNANPHERERLYKLRSNSDEEKKVKEGIQNLKNPDILILIEASNREQVLRICNSEGESYFVHGGPYDFVCVKNNIGDVIKHEQMPGGDGNSVGYVDVGLKDETGRKVRIFYAHFPSPQLKFSHEENVAHINAFGWIEVMLIRAAGSGIPCLIAGDLNNDFIRQRDDASIWSAKHIYEQIAKLNLWIFNPPPDGGLRDNYYEGTYRVEEEALLQRASTIDWVMGKNVVPPSRIPGAKPSSGGWIERDLSFVTNPPNWWKGSGFGDVSWLTFDHKPLYGKVVFFWEESIKPDIKDWKEYKLGAVSFSLPSDWEVMDTRSLPRDESIEEQRRRAVPSSHGIIEPEAFYVAASTTNYLDKKYVNLMASVVDAIFKDVESGKWRIVHYGMSGGKDVEEIGTTSRTISLGHMGRLVDSFKAEIAGLPVTVCVLRLTEKEGMSVKGVEFTNWSFALIRGGKHYAFVLTSANPTALNTFFKQFVSRIRLSQAGR